MGVFEQFKEFAKVKTKCQIDAWKSIRNNWSHCTFM